MTYKVVPADQEGRRETYLELWHRNLESVIQGRYEWLYEENPMGSPSCFYLQKEPDNSVVGAISLFPRTLYLDGRKITGFICGDLSVDKKHRALGPAVKLLKAAIEKCEKEAPCVLFTIPNRLSEPVMRRSGFDVLDEVREMTLVLSLYPYIQRRINNSAVARAVAFTVDPLLRLRPSNLFASKSNGRVVKHYNANADPGVDIRHNGYSLIGDRNNRFLKWRFMASPYARHRMFVPESVPTGKPKSYIVFSVSDKRASIADFCAYSKKELQNLLGAFAAYQRTLGTQSISVRFAGNSDLAACFHKKGYSLRPVTQKLFMYTSGRKELMEQIRNGRWYLTAADNDV